VSVSPRPASALGPSSFDLVDAVFIDSSVAGRLLEAYRRDSSPRMRFVAASGTSPRELFTVLGFDGSVPIFEAWKTPSLLPEVSGRRR
jgi:hypothetical protein